MQARIAEQHMELARNAEPGLWVAGNSFFHDGVPLPEQARVLVEHTEDGLWQTAIRGFNKGVPVTAVWDRSTHDLVVDEPGGIPHTVISRQRLHPVDARDAALYTEAVRQPEEPGDLLVQLLEHPEPSVYHIAAHDGWRMLRFGAVLIIANPDQVAFRVHGHDGADTSEPEWQRMRIDYAKGHYALREHSGSREWSLSPITQRATDRPFIARHVLRLTPRLAPPEWQAMERLYPDGFDIQAPAQPVEEPAATGWGALER